MPKYLVHIRLAEGRDSIDRIGQTMPRLREELDRIGKGSFTVAYQSKHGDSMGLFVICELTAKQIFERLAAPDRNPHFDPSSRELKGSIFDRQDQIMILSLGDDYSQQRYDAPITWLRNR